MTNSVAAFGAVLSAIAIAIAAAPALAQEGYPTKPIRMIVPYPPGGVGDTTARVLVPKWIELIGQQILVDNRPGAGANIGTEMVGKAAPDGYTIGFFDSAFVVNPSLYAKLPFDPLRDFTPIMLVARGPLLLVVHPAVAATNAIELVALAKAKPGAMSYASAGSGTAIHLGAEMLKNAAGLQIVHVPYKGAGPAVLGVVAGDVPMMFALPGTVRGHTSTGRLRPIAITGARRFSGLPDVPTFAEAGVPGVDATIILQFMAQAKTPRPIINALFVSLQKVVNAPEVRERLAEFALDVVGADPDRTATLLREEMELWAKVVKSSGAKAE